MFEQIQSRLDKVLTSIRGEGKITESNIDNALRDVRRALLEADVNYKVVKSFITRVKEKSKGHKVFSSIKPGEQFVKLLKDELTFFLGGEYNNDDFCKKRPSVILLSGLQGSGKTTTCVKLAYYLEHKKNRKSLLIAADLQRPAAIEQLKVLANAQNIETFHIEDCKDPKKVVKEGLKYSKTKSFDCIIIDTAGRLHIDDVLMNEIKEISQISNPTETLYVADSMTGQDAINSAIEFNSSLNITGIILTKLDGDSRGGAALSLRECTGKPIKFIGTGESIKSFDIFHPERMASRILGMGDIISLVEKAEQTLDKDIALSSAQRLKEGLFTFEDYKSQIQQIKKMGSLSSIMSMIPGFSKIKKNVNLNEDEFKWIEAIINSMTKKERNKPEILNGSRRKRIAIGSGSSVQEVNTLIKQFNQMKIMIKKMKNKNNMSLPFNFG
jgi:signal recognition particle subunit SRP54